MRGREPLEDSSLDVWWLREQEGSSFGVCPLVRASQFELRFVATAIHYAGWDRESSDYVFSEAGMIL